MLNQIIVFGKIARGFELRRTQSGKAVLSFDLPVQRDFKDQNGEKQTDWIPVVVWGNNAEFLAKYGEKGRSIIVTGRLQSRKYNDKSGSQRTAWEIQAENVYFADSKQSNSGGQSNGVATQETDNNEFTEIDEEGDLPFD